MTSFMAILALFCTAFTGCVHTPLPSLTQEPDACPTTATPLSASSWTGLGEQEILDIALTQPRSIVYWDEFTLDANSSTVNLVMTRTETEAYLVEDDPTDGYDCNMAPELHLDVSVEISIDDGALTSSMTGYLVNWGTERVQLSAQGTAVLSESWEGLAIENLDAYSSGCTYFFDVHISEAHNAEWSAEQIDVQAIAWEDERCKHVSTLWRGHWDVPAP